MSEKARERERERKRMMFSEGKGHGLKKKKRGVLRKKKGKLSTLATRREKIKISNINEL